LFTPNEREKVSSDSEINVIVEENYSPGEKILPQPLTKISIQKHPLAVS